jgi:hypothetical protein
MKHFQLITLLLIFILFSSCSKDELSLAGKKFVYSPYTVKDNDGQYLFWIYNFISNNEVQHEVRSNSTTGKLFTEKEIFEYKLDYPKLEIYEESGVFTFTFSNESSFKNDFNSTVYNLE